VQSGVIAIAAGDTYSMALKSDGSVVAWGDNYYGQTDVPPAAQSGVTAIAAGGFHMVALKDNGSVVAWGWNLGGQVTGTRPTNAPYSTIASPVILAGQVLTGVIAIAAGYTHTVALKHDGSVVAWGSSLSGETIVDVPPAALSGVKAIAAGNQFTVALKSDGSVLAWGRTNLGKINVPAAARSGVKAISTYRDTTTVLKDDGTVLAWGSNLYDQTTVPVGLRGVTAASTGGLHTVVLVDTGPEPALLRWPSANAMTLSWPANATGFTLQSMLNLTPPVTWLDVTNNPPAVLGGLFTVTNPMSSPAQFFRLRKP
jgi:alpha-tubulin suppressor-like RCC1 family protein